MHRSSGLQLPTLCQVAGLSRHIHTGRTFIFTQIHNFLIFVINIQQPGVNLADFRILIGLLVVGAVCNRDLLGLTCADNRGYKPLPPTINLSLIMMLLDVVS